MSSRAYIFPYDIVERRTLRPEASDEISRTWNFIDHNIRGLELRPVQGHEYEVVRNILNP